ncbi:MAG: NAD+ synthase [Syntrophobacterales bacterium]|jgi:NAD+ synthase (glutamine-hydrolysing)|nr:NAD+ synthase [Syntrophobacterales bacterium]
MKITLAQLNPVVGDVSGNLKKVVETFEQVRRDSDLVVFSELFLTGYPPRDLLEKPALLARVQEALAELVSLSARYPDTGLLVGAPQPTGQNTGKGLCNCAVLIHQGRVRLRQGKSLLPTYDVFDETRHFDPAETVEVAAFKDEVLGISICEDAWYDPELWFRRLYPLDPIRVEAHKGATVLINISASPFQVGKEEVRHHLLQPHARKYQVPLVYVNQVGGNDELIFDGHSLALDPAGEAIAVLPGFREAVVTVDLAQPGTPGLYAPAEPIAAVYEALVLGLRDYLHKCGFAKAVVGLSGGVDSAVTCCLAAAALGPENVLGVLMPSPYTSRASIADSEILARNLGVPVRLIPITSIYQSYREALAGPLQLGEIEVTLENIQARIRGNILMAISNKEGHMVLSTGNKSEIAVGYCTLYGDMSGGLSVLADVPKTMVYELAAFINRHRELIPGQIIRKAPSAELRPDQKDQDTLPPYDLLDQIMNHYLVEGLSYGDIVKLGFDPETVRWIIRTIDRSEYKRRQAAPGLKITSKAFGMGRRIPIAARFEL